MKIKITICRLTVWCWSHRPSNDDNEPSRIETLGNLREGREGRKAYQAKPQKAISVKRKVRQRLHCTETPPLLGSAGWRIFSSLISWYLEGTVEKAMAIWKGVISDIECLPITKMMNMWRLCVTSATHQAWNGSHSLAGSPQMTWLPRVKWARWLFCLDSPS